MKMFRLAAFIMSFSFFTTLFGDTVMAEDKTPLYAELLQQYVVNGQVDYTGFKEKEAQLDIYRDYLAETAPAQTC